MNEILLLKLGELVLKGLNRKLFENVLLKRIQYTLCDLGKFDIKLAQSTITIVPQEETIDLEEAAERVSKIFGIAAFSRARVTEKNMDAIKQASAEYLAEELEAAKTFKVEAKRSDKKFPLNSPQICTQVGEYLLEAYPHLTVDVHNPDYLLHIEIRKDYTYIYHKEIKASGGYPVSVAGRGLLMLSGGIDSPVAGYLAMKRGIKIECVYFESPPHTSVMAKNKVKKLVEELTKYDSSITLNVVKFTALQEAIYKNIDPTYMITIMRRMMYRISEKIMEKTSCLCLINGESVGQVASQTLTSMRVINSVTNVPVIRPVACLDKLEIIDISRKIGTYETSILPYEDCCTIFLPKHPVINPNMDKAILYEKSFDFNFLIDEAVNSREIIEIKRNNTKFDI